MRMVVIGLIVSVALSGAYAIGKSAGEAHGVTFKACERILYIYPAPPEYPSAFSSGTEINGVKR